MVKIDNEPSFALSKHALDSGIVVVQVEVFDEFCEVFDIPLAPSNVSSPSVVPSTAIHAPLARSVATVDKSRHYQRI